MALLLPMSQLLLAGGSSAAAAWLLPAAQHGLRACCASSASVRHSASTRLAAPRPLLPADDTTTSWTTLSPLAHELARAAGGFKAPAHWPLDNLYGLLDVSLTGSSSAAGALLRPGAPQLVHLSATSHQPSSCYSYAAARRTYSVMPPRAPISTTPSPLHPGAPAQQQAAEEHTAASVVSPIILQDEATPATAATSTTATADDLQRLMPAWMAAMLPKAHPRPKGLSRKLLLRQLNRKIIARVARRATIGIPVLGFYFVSKLVVRDVARVRAELAAGSPAVAGLFAIAVAADVLDLAAQLTIITGLAHANLGVAGLAGAAALLVAADKASLATAALSFSAALAGERLALARDEALEQQQGQRSSSD